MPNTLVKEYKIVTITESGEEQTVAHETNNRARLIKKQVDMRCKAIKLVPLATWGKPTAAVFSMDVK